MFKFLKKPKPAITRELLHAQVAASAEEMRLKWIQFHNTIHFKAEIPLAEKIDAFVTLVRVFFDKKYPYLKRAQLFWICLSMAIGDSKTHSFNETQAALSALEPKYGE